MTEKPIDPCWWCREDERFARECWEKIEKPLLIEMFKKFDDPQRYTGIRRGEFAAWKNHDKSVSKLLFRNADGKLFDLQFFPMEEPIV